MKKMYCLLSLALPPLALLHAQAPQQLEAPYIEVTGTAENAVVPDEIYLGIAISEKNDGRIKTSIETQEIKLKDAIQNVGINLENLYLSGAAADLVKVKWRKKDAVSKKGYTLKLSSATELGKVLQALDGIDIDDAQIIKLGHSQMEVLRKEVRIAAMKAAKEKADYMLAAIGEKTGKPLVVKDVSDRYLDYGSSGAPGASSNIYMRQQDGYNYDIKDKDGEIEFNKINIKTSVYIKFSIQN